MSLFYAVNSHAFMAAADRTTTNRQKQRAPKPQRSGRRATNAAAQASAQSQPSRQSAHTPTGNWAKSPKAYFVLMCAPPTAVVLSVLPISAVALAAGVWLACRVALQILSLHKLAIVVGHVITIYCSYTLLPEANSRLEAAGDDPTSPRRLVATGAVAIAMGISFRNLTRFGSWLMGGSLDYRAGEPPNVLGGDPRLCLRVSMSDAEAKVRGPNVHGAREFVVKVQLPMGGMGGISGGMGMCYDERRTFQVFVRLESEAQPDATAAMVRLIATEGDAGGLRGYFLAKRLGDDLLIFVDRLVPGESVPGQW